MKLIAGSYFLYSRLPVIITNGIGYFDYKNKISPAKADGAFSYIFNAKRAGIIHIWNLGSLEQPCLNDPFG